MADKENAKEPTAEQQLLSLIEGQDKGKEAAANSANATSKPLPKVSRKAPLFASELLKGKLAFAQDSFKGLFRSRDMDQSLSLVNNLLIACISVIFIYLAIEIMSKPKRIEDVSELLSIRKQIEEKAVGMPVAKEISYYLDKIKNRDIFKPKPKEEEVKPVELAPEPKISRAQEVIADLRLVGIAAGETEAESYVMKVKEILPNKVILSDGKESVDLQ